MPLSPSTKFEVPEKKSYPALPGNIYQVQITDIKEKLKAPYGKPWDIPDEEKEIYITFEFTILNEGEYYGRKLWKDMRPVPPTPPEGNYNASWMFRLVSAVKGNPETFANAVNWGADETNALIGEQLRIVVIKKVKGDKTYNDITEVVTVEQQLPPFDEAKVPKENQPENAPKGYDKFKTAAQTIHGGNRSMAGQNEAVVAPDIEEEAARLAAEDVNVEDVPF